MASKKVKKSVGAAGAKKAKKGSARVAVAVKKAPVAAGKKKAVTTPAKPSARKAAASLASIRDGLLRERARLEKRLGMIRNDDSTVEAANVGDLADAASHHETREILRGLQLTEAEQLDQIESALERIEAGGYGKCVRCGGPIEEARLEALPHAPTCINCRRREERGEFKGKR